MRKKQKFFLYIIMLIALIVFLLPITTRANTSEKVSEEIIDITSMDIEEISYKDFLSKVDNNEIKCIYYTSSLENFYIETNENTFYISKNPQYSEFKKDMLEKGIDVETTDSLYINNNKETEKNSKTTMRMFICLAISCLLFAIVQNKTKKNKKDTITSIGIRKKETAGNTANESSNSSKIKDSNIKLFSDIAGLKEVKKDMWCLVDFLKNKDKYTSAGAKLPKGVILYGPPGTGKTLLAKAIAGEAGIPFFAMSGSDFIEMYVGVGAKRVRELFNKAKQNAPCLIFIDEIDAIGGKRSNPDSNGEDRKTINALLTEMDGFKETENILVIAATNRLEDLDPALTRPGRFTDKYCVPLPETAKERLEIINLYIKNKKFAEDVDFNQLAKETIGFSPAEIEALLNESAIISVQENSPYINKAIIDKAMFKMLLSGHIKDNQKDRNKEELQLVAWHEAGHALIGKLVGKDVTKVTILSSTSGAGGVTFSTPKKQNLHSVEDLKNEVKELYGGRCAEYMLFKDNDKVTTGASNDIERATKIIKEIVSTLGMTESFGLLNLTQLNVNSEIVTQKEIELSKQLEAETKNMLTKHYDKLKAIAESLLENETIYANDLDNIMEIQ